MDKHQVLRTIDKADRMPPLDIFDLLTKGRIDTSGAFTPGCGLDNSQAAFLVSLVSLVKKPLSAARMQFIESLEMMIIQDGVTAWDKFLDMYCALPEPKNIAWVIDDCLAALAPKTKGSI